LGIVVSVHKILDYYILQDTKQFMLFILLLLLLHFSKLNSVLFNHAYKAVVPGEVGRVIAWSIHSASAPSTPRKTQRCCSPFNFLSRLLDLHHRHTSARTKIPRVFIVLKVCLVSFTCACGLSARTHTHAHAVIRTTVKDPMSFVGFIILPVIVAPVYLPLLLPPPPSHLLDAPQLTPQWSPLLCFPPSSRTHR